MISILFTSKDPFGTFIYGQFDPSLSSPEDISQQAKDLFTKLSELRNESNFTDSSSSSSFEDSNDTSGSPIESSIQALATDVSGHYSNPKYGIIDFIIPDGWFGTERQWSGDQSISLDLHPGTETEFLDSLLTPPSSTDPDSSDDVITTMTLDVNDKNQLQMTESLLPDTSSILDTVGLGGQCKILEPNSTATIDGKIFSVSTMECTYMNNENQLEGFDSPVQNASSPTITTVEVLKKYEYESDDRIYFLQLTASKDLYLDSQDVSNNLIDSTKYTPIVDTAAKSLRLE